MLIFACFNCLSEICSASIVNQVKHCLQHECNRKGSTSADSSVSMHLSKGDPWKPVVMPKRCHSELEGQNNDLMRSHSAVILPD